MRIVIVSESFLPRVNGVSNSVIRAARILRERGHEMLIVAPDTYTAKIFEGIRVETINSLEIPGIHETDVAIASTETLRQILLEFSPDVVHLASPFVLGAAAQRAARKLGIPTIAVFQTDVSGFARHYGIAPAGFIADRIVKRIHSKATLNLVPSSDSAHYLKNLGVAHIERWGRGVDVEMFHPKWRVENLYGQGSRPVVGFLGRLAPEKRVDILRQVFLHEDATIVVIGDGPERANLERLLPEAHFLGRLGGNDLSRSVASLDVMVAPGETETFCQVIQEAMAAGVPVVAPATGGPKDLVLHAVNGYLYEAENTTEFLKYIKVLCSDKKLREEMSRDARLSVQDRTWPALITELEIHYNNAIEMHANNTVGSTPWRE